MTQFYKFHHLELQNLIPTYFKTFLENKENSKVACREENGSQILLKMGFPRTLKKIEDENFEIEII